MFVRLMCTSTLPVKTVPAKSGFLQRLNDGLEDGEAVALDDAEGVGDEEDEGETDGELDGDGV